MKKLLLAPVILVALFMGACCPIDKKAVSDLEASDNLIIPAYLNYVDKDSALNKDQKDDRKKLVESRKRLLEAMKKAVD